MKLIYYITYRLTVRIYSLNKEISVINKFKYVNFYSNVKYVSID